VPSPARRPELQTWRCRPTPCRQAAWQGSAAANRHDEAITRHLQGLEIARQIGDEFGEAASLGDLAAAYAELGRYAEAADCGQQSLRIYRAIGPQRNEGLNLIIIGDASRGMGQLDQALAHIREGLDIVTMIGAVGLEAMALRHMAKIYHEQGCYDDAIELTRRAALISNRTLVPTLR
jgi:tetratricopeptide (TPR) repeat protein